MRLLLKSIFPHTWRELNFPQTLSLSSRLKTTSMSCCCLYANLSLTARCTYKDNREDSATVSSPAPRRSWGSSKGILIAPQAENNGWRWKADRNRCLCSSKFQGMERGRDREHVRLGGKETGP